MDYQAAGEEEGCEIDGKGKDYNILLDILEALETWTQRLLDIETSFKKTTDLRCGIFDSLRRQQLDGFISEQYARELEYTADLWIKLHTAFSCKSTGGKFNDRDVLTYLLELYDLKQISKELFVRIALAIC